MSDVTIIGFDLAKRVVQLHGARADGAVVFRKKLTRAQLLSFPGDQPRCVVAMDACATAHGWGREIAKLGHTMRLIPPAYVKPFVKRQKNDAADAEAIAEAAQRPTMRFVAVKNEEQQSLAMLFRTRQMFVAQRTQLINASRAATSPNMALWRPGARRTSSAWLMRWPTRPSPCQRAPCQRACETWVGSIWSRSTASTGGPRNSTTG